LIIIKDNKFIVNCDYCNKIKEYDLNINKADIFKDGWIKKNVICFCSKGCFNACKDIRKK
jgi:hypothetical protein